MKIEVGKRYRMRDGTITDPITRRLGCLPYSVKDESEGKTWTEEGIYDVDEQEHPCDLVEEYAEEVDSSQEFAIRAKCGVPLENEPVGTPILILGDNFEYISTAQTRAHLVTSRRNYLVLPTSILLPFKVYLKPIGGGKWEEVATDKPEDGWILKPQ